MAHREKVYKCELQVSSGPHKGAGIHRFDIEEDGKFKSYLYVCGNCIRALVLAEYDKQRS